MDLLKSIQLINMQTIKQLMLIVLIVNLNVSVISFWSPKWELVM